jgi:predicted nucleic acid-binding protein
MSSPEPESFGLDSSIISFRMKGNATVVRNMDSAHKSKSTIVIPPFAYYEVKRGLLAINATKRLQEFANLCKDCPVGNLDDLIIDEAVKIHVDLKHKGWNIDEMDIFIAAYCKVHGLTLVTNNTRHFAAISGLSLVDWSVE